MDRGVRSIKQMANLVKRPASLPAPPHQCSLSLGVVGSRPSMLIRVAVQVMCSHSRFIFRGPPVADHAK
jgi:hypothetical protein